MFECDVLKVDPLPGKPLFPTVSLTTYLKQTEADIIHLFKHPRKKFSPLLLGPTILNAFTEVTTILGRACEPPLYNTARCTALRVLTPMHFPRVLTLRQIQKHICIFAPQYSIPKHENPQLPHMANMTWL